jgi:heavy metal sensor kinase
MFSAIRARLTLKSVRARLTFWYLLTLGSSLAGFAIFVYLVRAHALYQELDADLDVRSHQLASDLRVPLLALDLRETLSTDARALNVALLIREVPGSVIFRSPSFPVLSWEAERTLATSARESGRIVTISDRDGLTHRVESITIDRPGADELTVQMAASTAGARRALGQLAGAMGVAILLVLAVASYGSGFTARRALAPVDEIVARAQLIEAHHPGERLDIHAGSAELDRLVTTLNGMLDRIDRSVRGARRFAADASHEIQTPLGAMRNAVEMCVRRPRRPEEYHEMAVGLLAEIDRLSALVRDLRLLALADAGHLLDERTPIDLSVLTIECCEIAQEIAEDKQILVLAAVDPVVVEGSALHLRRAILNLAQNAIRYSPPSTNVEVRLQRVNGDAVLSVADHGCGIPASDLPHIFERFYRADPARARETGGSGLGLAIVEEIVRAHRGRIDVASEPGTGSVFTICLPLGMTLPAVGS